MSHPEYLYLGAGGIALAGGFAEAGGWPDNGVKVVAATVILSAGASAFGNSRFKPIVSAFGWLALIAAVYGTVPALQAAQKKPQKKKVIPTGGGNKGKK